MNSTNAHDSAQDIAQTDEVLLAWVKPTLNSTSLNDAMTGDASSSDGGGYLHS